MANMTLVHNAGVRQVDPIEELVSAVKGGRMIILMDDEDRENEGDLVCAAEYVTPQVINFMAKYGRGLICLALTEARCAQLNLPLMVADNRSPFSTNFTISIEAAEGVTTGISAADRARTVQAAVKKDAKPDDLVQPGHIFPLMAKKGGVLVRVGQTEGSIDLAHLAGLEPAAVICEILKEDGEMARLPDLLEFSRQHNIKIGTIADLVHYRSQHERLVERVTTRLINTHYGPFTLHAYLDKTVNETHLALVRGDVHPEVETLVRVHEPLSVMDLLDITGGRHSYGVSDAMRLIAEKGSGVIVLLHHPESGADLLAQVSRQEHGRGAAVKWDPRIYGIGAQILHDLNVGKMCLLARPAKMPSMAGFNLEVTGFVEPGSDE
jgi:3,4-dihydroxy 2-butanone 4-phosphate synthase / GTP cyclohydrolase II